MDAGGRAPTVGALGDAGAVAESSAMDGKLKPIHGAWIPAIHLCPVGMPE
jgi:hypothetical protein